MAGVMVGLAIVAAASVHAKLNGRQF